MTRRYQQWMALLALVGLLVTSVPTFAQDPLPPLVVFVEDTQLQTASATDPGPDGVTRLIQIFESLGARTAWIRLSEPIPDDAQILVLVRPVRTLPVPYLARLWTHLARGNHLLLAIDPSGPLTPKPDKPVAINTEKSNGGLSALLMLVYGVGLRDTFLAEPWFTHAIIADQRTAFSRVFAEDVVSHAVTDPLVAYDLPVQVWGARSLAVEPLGPHSTAVPLLYTETAYGETAKEVFSTQEPLTPLEVNIGSDEQGRLLVGALAENTLSGSRLVVLGDSEIVQNDFGLAVDANTQQPLHWGDRLLVERIAAWLLDRPVESWPTLPASFTRLTVDGRVEEWADRPVLKEDLDDIAPPPKIADIQQVRAFYDDAYLYVLIETAGSPSSGLRATMGIENTWDGETDRVVRCEDERVVEVTASGTMPVSDARCAVSDAIELRLPVRLTGVGGLINELCLAERGGGRRETPLDCVEPPLGLVPLESTMAPLQLMEPAGPYLSVFWTDPVNLRASPGTDAPVVAFLPHGMLLEAVGRTEASDWILVQNAAMEGWLAAVLLRPNFNLADLPVVESSAGTPPAGLQTPLDGAQPTRPSGAPADFLAPMWLDFDQNAFVTQSTQTRRQ